MSKPKITQRVSLLLHHHNNADATSEELKKWTTERMNFLLSKLDWCKHPANTALPSDPISLNLVPT